ncbi:hypothetical protein F0365_09975 [Nonlabens sp. Ci31]|jgi:hypothetical protein|uniref:hypothetical protein n=1 Tax=Nonlabens sp. Ci31 TaxID=2608253 RepID=UPI0014642906|nr:hypothetical protein [Nonlabens sp. Ci31]QJP34696.1 hypothetical protein F0365_09975 [Nonlabens sp. Ci31]
MGKFASERGFEISAFNFSRRDGQWHKISSLPSIKAQDLGFVIGHPCWIASGQKTLTAVIDYLSELLIGKLISKRG